LLARPIALLHNLVDFLFFDLQIVQLYDFDEVLLADESITVLIDDLEHFEQPRLALPLLSVTDCGHMDLARTVMNSSNSMLSSPFSSN
jgi:hypothetical protein